MSTAFKLLLVTFLALSNAKRRKSGGAMISAPAIGAMISAPAIGGSLTLYEEWQKRTRARGLPDPSGFVQMFKQMSGNVMLTDVDNSHAYIWPGIPELRIDNVTVSLEVTMDPMKSGRVPGDPVKIDAEFRCKSGCGTENGGSIGSFTIVAKKRMIECYMSFWYQDKGLIHGRKLLTKSNKIYGCTVAVWLWLVYAALEDWGGEQPQWPLEIGRKGITNPLSLRIGDLIVTWEEMNSWAEGMRQEHDKRLVQVDGKYVYKQPPRGQMTHARKIKYKEVTHEISAANWEKFASREGVIGPHVTACDNRKLPGRDCLTINDIDRVAELSRSFAEKVAQEQERLFPHMGRMEQDTQKFTERESILAMAALLFLRFTDNGKMSIRMAHDMGLADPKFIQFYSFRNNLQKPDMISEYHMRKDQPHQAEADVDTEQFAKNKPNPGSYGADKVEVQIGFYRHEESDAIDARLAAEEKTEEVKRGLMEQEAAERADLEDSILAEAGHAAEAEDAAHDKILADAKNADDAQHALEDSILAEY